MTKNIIFTIFFIVTSILPLYSMEHVLLDPQEGPDRFSIQFENYNLLFRTINLHSLDQKDHQTLLQEFGDFDAVGSMFGYCVAIPFKLIHLISPEKILEIYREEYDKKYSQMPEGQKIMYQWLIENQRENNELVGKLSITTYIDERPAAYKDTLLLEIGLFISEKYRNKKITTTLASLVKKKLEAWRPFNTGTFCFSTRTDNQAIHKFAQSQGATLILTHERPVDFGLFTLNESCNLFIIKRKQENL